jgi:hypothetical protein
VSKGDAQWDFANSENSGCYELLRGQGTHFEVEAKISGWRLLLEGIRQFRGKGLFLAQKIDVGVTAGTRIDDGGKVPGKIVGVTSSILQLKSKGTFNATWEAPMILPSLHG